MKKFCIKTNAVLLAIIFTAIFSGCSGSDLKNSGNPNIRLNINKLESQGIDKKIISRIAEKLHAKLASLRGKNKVLYRGKDGVAKSANRQLAGRISKLGSKYILTIKVIEGEKGSMLFNKTVSTKEKDLDDEIDDIAEDISDDENIW